MTKAIGALAAMMVFGTLLIGPLFIAISAAGEEDGPACLRDFSCNNMVAR